MGTLANVVGNIQQGQAAKAASNYNVAVEQENIKAAQASTADTVERIEHTRDLTLGNQRAGFSGAGVRLEGSPLRVASETIRLADRDAWRARVTGDYAVAGATARANYARYSGDVAVRQSYTNAFGSLLTGGGQLGLSYLQGKYFSGVTSSAARNQLALSTADASTGTLAFPGLK